MKSAACLVAIGATFAAAQSGFDALASCGKTCIINMANLAPSFGCTEGNTACLCTKPDYNYGIRDCANQACAGDAGAASAAIAYGLAECADALSSVGATSILATAVGSSSSSGSGSSSATSTGSSSASTSSGASGAGAGGVRSGSGSATATSPLVAVITSGGSTITSTTGSTTLYAGTSGTTGTTGASGIAGAASSSGSSAVSAASASGSSAVSQASASGSNAVASASSAGSSVVAGASSAVVGAAAMMTASPALGMGLAALAALAL